MNTLILCLASAALSSIATLLIVRALRPKPKPPGEYRNLWYAGRRDESQDSLLLYRNDEGQQVWLHFDQWKP